MAQRLNGCYNIRGYIGTLPKISTVLLSRYSIVACVRCCRQLSAADVLTIADVCTGVLACAQPCSTGKQVGTLNVNSANAEYGQLDCGLVKTKQYTEPTNRSWNTLREGVADLHPHYVAPRCRLSIDN